MKILAIRGKNIASLEGEFSIDFTVEPLLSTGIFAISGPTGAGKSTLLDTMCLALFAQTPRTMQAREQKVYVRDVNDEVLGQNDPRFLLRRGTVSGYAEVDFLGLTGYKYRARWSVGRARDKETGRLQNYRVTLHNLDKEAEEQGNRSDIQKRIIELVGLTFEQFTRSVLLAQNDFSNFLKAEQGEKASLLEKLTGTEQYSRISRLVYEKTGEAKNAYDQINQSILGIELLPAEEESELTQRVKIAEKELERLAQLRTSKQELTDRVKNAEQLIQTKKQQQKETATLLDNSVTRLVEATQQNEKEKEEYQKAEDTYKKRMPEIRQATQLDIEIRSYIPVVEEAKQQWQKAQESAKNRTEQIRILEQNIQQGEEQNKQLNEWFIKYRDKENVANQINSLLIHLDDASVIKKQLQQAEQKITHLITEQKELEIQVQKVKHSVVEKEQIRQQTEAKLKEEQKKIESISSEKIEKETAFIRKERETLLIEKARFITTGDIASLRDKLIPSEPCPVCGSSEHPYASPAVHREMQEREKKIAELTLYLKELENQLQAYQKCQTAIAHIQQVVVEKEKELSQWKEKLSELQNKGKILAGQIATEQQLKLEQQKRMERSLQATSTLFGNDAWQANWLSNPDNFRTTLVSFAESWSKKKKQQEETVKQLDIYRTELAVKKELSQKEEESLKEHHKIYQEKQTVYNRFLKERSLLLDGKPAQQVEEQMTTAIEKHRKRSDELQKTVQEQSAQVDRMKGVAGQIRKELETVEKEWEEHARNLQIWIEANNVSSQGFTIEQETEQITRQKSEWTFRLRTHTENLKKVESFRKELENCRQKYDQWAKLNELVGSADGAKFRRIAQGYTLDILINYANIQLRNLTHRYRLERIPDTLALQVIDRDMCDEVRTVHSLSGGESFLVSLALALGLSSLSSNRMKVESLFIDEGFGSLDSDTLRIAMDALESLRTQGRKIGVISHVQEMTERIPVQIKVCRSGNGRSYLDINA